MKKIHAIFLSILITVSCNIILAQETTKTTKSDSAFMARIKALPGVVDIEKINFTGKWEGKYRISFLQAINPNNISDGFFLQKLYLNHKDFNKPMLVITEGYAANYGEIAMYQNEITDIVDGNQLIIEHRYFGESLPETLDWDFLTVANAAADHHNVI